MQENESLRSKSNKENRHAVRAERLKLRNEAIKKEFNKLYAKKKLGKRLYSKELIVTLVANKFYLSEKTIEDIVYLRVTY